MTHAPQLTAYREFIMNDQNLRNFLSIRNCILNPLQALHKSILEPLMLLKKGKNLRKYNTDTENGLVLSTIGVLELFKLGMEHLKLPYLCGYCRYTFFFKNDVVVMKGSSFYISFL